MFSQVSPSRLATEHITEIGDNLVDSLGINCQEQGGDDERGRFINFFPWDDVVGFDICDFGCKQRQRLSFVPFTKHIHMERSESPSTHFDYVIDLSPLLDDWEGTLPLGSKLITRHRQQHQHSISSAVDRPVIPPLLGLLRSSSIIVVRRSLILST